MEFAPLLAVMMVLRMVMNQMLIAEEAAVLVKMVKTAMEGMTVYLAIAIMVYVESQENVRMVS
jgi:hypothetical protein